MKFITDENLGVQVPRFLKSLGYDVTSVTEIALNRPDIDVLAIANEENRILLTTDKDFGELVFKEKLVHFGVILLRLKDESVKNELLRSKLRSIPSGKFLCEPFIPAASCEVCGSIIKRKCFCGS